MKDDRGDDARCAFTLLNWVRGERVNAVVEPFSIGDGVSWKTRHGSWEHGTIIQLQGDQARVDTFNADYWIYLDELHHADKPDHWSHHVRFGPPVPMGNRSGLFGGAHVCKES